MRAVACPKCCKTLKSDSLAPEEQLSIHYAMDCKGKKKYKKKKKVCAAKKCFKKLTRVNKFKCKTCEKELCLFHRNYDGHDCKKEGEKLNIIKADLSKYDLAQKIPIDILTDKNISKEELAEMSKLPDKLHLLNLLKKESK